MRKNGISESYSKNAVSKFAPNGEIYLPNIEELNPRHKLHVRAGAEIRWPI